MLRAISSGSRSVEYKTVKLSLRYNYTDGTHAYWQTRVGVSLSSDLNSALSEIVDHYSERLALDSEGKYASIKIISIDNNRVDKLVTR